MISKEHRFHRRNDIASVYKRGQVARAQKLTLRYTPAKKDQPYRLAVVVSKKVDKRAVVRNRIRRRIYEIIRHYEPTMTRQYDMVLSVHSAVFAEMPHEELRESIKKLTKR